MVSKKHTVRATPKTSAAASLAVSESTGLQPSSVLKGAFAPSVFQLSLFASVIQAFDGQQLQVHDTQSNRLLCQHRVPRSRITTLDWGFHRSDTATPHESTKKRKRLVEDLNGVESDAGEIVIGFGTEHSDINFFSPTTSRITSSLQRTHRGGIKEFRFQEYGRNNEAWSLGGDKSLIQWDLSTGHSVRTIAVPLSPPCTISPLSGSVLVASHDIYIVDLAHANHVDKLGHGTNAVHTLIASTSSDSTKDLSAYIAISESESQALVHEVNGTNKSISALNAEAEILQAALSLKPKEHINGARDLPSTEQLIAFVTKAGTVEIFRDPFNQTESTTQTHEAMNKRKSLSRKATAKVRICPLNESSAPYPVAGVTFDGNYLVIAYIERSGCLAFDRLPCTEWSNKSTPQEADIFIRKAPTAIGVAKSGLTSHEDDGHVRVNEAQAVVVRDTDMTEAGMPISRPEPITISSGEEESDFDDAEDLENNDSKLPNGTIDENRMLLDEPKSTLAGDDQSVDEEPSFGDLIRANESRVVNVVNHRESENDQVVVPFGRHAGTVSSGLSLGTVLSQALRANDKALLESCLQEQDLHTVRATVERLDGPLAMALLQRLAEKLYSRPGRSGALMVWVQWTIVSHGGYLASQPDRARKLADLQHVIKARANTLQPLLSLKGKLDMLEAQMSLRRSMQKRSAMGAVTPGEAETAALYIEGEDGSESDATDNERLDVDSDSADDMHDAADLDMDSNHTDELQSEGGFIDNEAIESDQSGEDDSGEEAVDYDDAESVEEASDDEQPETRRRDRVVLKNGVQEEL